MKIIIKIYLIVFGLICLASCTNNREINDIDNYFGNLQDSLDVKSEVLFANGFDIYRTGEISKVVIKNPRNPQIIIEEYYLVNDVKTKNSFNKNENIIVVPIERAAVFSGTQLSALIKTGLTDKVVGVSEVSYINDPSIKTLISKGDIVELASNGEFYLETVLKVNPEVIFHSPYKLNETHPLAVTKINMIPFLDFMETDPVGRAEWLKFTSVFFGKEYLADSIFENIVSEYNKYAQLVKDIESKPSVFSDKYFSGQWYVPGGNSYVAQLFNDAASDYIWKSNDGVASFPLDYEVVFQKASKADYWRIVGITEDDDFYNALSLENELYSHFDAFKNRKIIWCNSKTSAYFENSPLEPHIVLADLINCFHPDLLPDYSPKYYRLMK